MIFKSHIPILKKRYVNVSHTTYKEHKYIYIHLCEKNQPFDKRSRWLMQSVKLHGWLLIFNQCYFQAITKADKVVSLKEVHYSWLCYVIVMYKALLCGAALAFNVLLHLHYYCYACEFQHSRILYLCALSINYYQRFSSLGENKLIPHVACPMGCPHVCSIL